MDIYNTPLYYISFNKEKRLESNLKEVGFTNINHFKAIDGRKMDPLDLINEKKISIRTFHDLNTDRRQHSGIPSLGAIGCTMSHDALWQMCIDEDLPYLIIAEGDLKMKPISDKNYRRIQNIMKNEKSIYVSPHSTIDKNEGITRFTGMHFYIISQSACKELVSSTFPIDVQTDAYISHMDTINKIHIGGFSICSQQIHMSGLQDVCVKCWLPNKSQYYIITVLLLITVYMYSKKKS